MENSKAKRDLINELRKRRFCHVTSVGNYRKIRDAGTVTPNDGSLPFSFGQSQASRCFQIGGVSVFSFQSKSIETLFSEDSKMELGNLNDVMTKHTPTAVFMCFDRLPQEPLSYDEMRKLTPAGGVSNGYLEFCHRGAIPLEFAARHVLVCNWNMEIYSHDVIAKRRLSDTALRKVQRAHAKVVKNLFSI
jgi:hypothetical protein